MIKTSGTSCTKLDHSLRIIGVTTENNHITNVVVLSRQMLPGGNLCVGLKRLWCTGDCHALLRVDTRRKNITQKERHGFIQLRAPGNIVR